MVVVWLILGQLGLLVCADRYPWLEQVTRQEQLSNSCNHYKVTGLHKNSFDHILVDHKHRLLYCYVPKVACTNWKRVFMLLTGVASNSKLADIPGSVAHAENSTARLAQLPNSTIQYCLENYTTFIMVRHPFERLLSAFRNKFENTYSEYFQIRYGRDIIKRYRHNATSAEVDKGVVSFAEFVRYILDEGPMSNEHWQPIYNLCYPCSLNYSFIGRYETLVEDSRALLDMVGAPFVDFPATKPSNTSTILKRYFQQLSMTQIQQLHDMYKLDFKLFGYNLEGLLGFDLA